MEVRKPKNILFIQGVYASKCNINLLINQKFDAEITTDIVEEGNEWDTIPDYFYSTDKWPKKLNILCHTCSIKCDEIFLSIPLNYEIPDNTKYKIKMFGGFNSWECVAYYINKHFPTDKDKLHRNLLKWHNTLTNSNRISEIIPANSPVTMVQYGGIYSSQTWLKLNKIKNDQYEEEIRSIGDNLENI